jgi:hypothetical protein
MNKLNQLKTPKERLVELVDKVLYDELFVESISISRSTKDTGAKVLLVELELNSNDR